MGDPRWIPCGNAEVESAFCLTEVAGALESFRSKNENEDKVRVCKLGHSDLIVTQMGNSLAAAHGLQNFEEKSSP